LAGADVLGCCYVFVVDVANIAVAFPSFKLLYLMDEVSDPAMSVLAGVAGGGIERSREEGEKIPANVCDFGGGNDGLD